MVVFTIDEFKHAEVFMEMDTSHGPLNPASALSHSPSLALFLKLMEAYLRVRIKKNTIMFYCYNNYVVAVLPIATLLNESWAKCLHGRLDGTKCSLIVANW